MSNARAAVERLTTAVAARGSTRHRRPRRRRTDAAISPPPRLPGGPRRRPEFVGRLAACSTSCVTSTGAWTRARSQQLRQARALKRCVTSTVLAVSMTSRPTCPRAPGTARAREARPFFPRLGDSDRCATELAAWACSRGHARRTTLAAHCRGRTCLTSRSASDLTAIGPDGDGTTSIAVGNRSVRAASARSIAATAVPARRRADRQKIQTAAALPARRASTGRPHGRAGGGTSIRPAIRSAAIARDRV
jgi:hypothetical protein